VTCLTDSDVVELLDGQPAPDRRARIVTHLEACAACREVVGVAAPIEPGRLAIAAGDEIGGRYVVREAIGAGAMGVVYRATDPRLSRDVAVKLLDPRRGAPARLLAEAHALARLAHPNVVAIHDVGTHAERIFLAMELGRETLASWLRTPRTPREILRLLAQAGEGLAAAHATGLVHRDVKPANIIIGHDGRASITDFGLARSQDAIAYASQDDPVLVGTPAYMAPEQLRGEPCDERADQFAYCVTAFEALTGARPFAGRSVAQLRREATTGKVRHADRVPGWLRRILLRGLRGDPAARWPSMRALLDAIGRGPPLRRARVIVGATAGLAVIAVVASLAWGLWQTGRQRARADRRFDEVRQMATSLLFEFHDAIANLPGATKARALVVARAQGYLESLAREAGPADVSLQRDLARAYHVLSDLQGGSNASLGEHRAALASLDRAIAIGEAIVADHPDDRAATEELADALASRAGTSSAPDRLAAASRALALRTRLAALAPGDRAAQNHLASSELTLGIALIDRDELAAATVHERAAVARWEQQLALAPADRTLQRNTALGSKYLAGVLQRQGDFAAAGPFVARAVALDEARVAAAPDDPQAKLDLSYSYGSLAYHKKRVRDFDGALAAYQRALALREAMAAADPANANAARAVARAENSIGRVLRDAGRLADALVWNTRAARRYEALSAADPADVPHRTDLADVYADVGQTESALAAAAQTAAQRRAHDLAACERAAQSEAALAPRPGEATPPVADPSTTSWLAEQRATCAALAAE
jgi:tRNA A-37 threonylcarbamoyl transferase component Bud32/tetratricopeptide (TPR) repeat protein